MSSVEEQTFPFLRLPREIRDKVYKELLCSFAPPKTTLRVGDDDIDPFQPKVLDHSVQTAILFTCTQIHREAYDVMVKTNRYVLIQCSGGLPIVGLMFMTPVNVVTKSRRHALRMRDFVLSIYLSTEQPLDEHPTSPVDPFVFVILNRDVPDFCRGLIDTGNLIMNNFDKHLKMTINVAPKAFKSPASRRYRTPLDSFFTETTLDNLLRPFRTKLRGFTNVLVTGAVPPDLAAAVQDGAASPRAVDWQAALKKMEREKEVGRTWFQQGNLERASLAWLDSAADIDSLRDSNSWKKLVQAGGEEFLTSVAEFYFLMRLNIAHTELVRAAAGNYFTILAQDTLLMARRSLGAGFWKSGQWKWQPEDKHKAKL